MTKREQHADCALSGAGLSFIIEAGDRSAYWCAEANSVETNSPETNSPETKSSANKSLEYQLPEAYVITEVVSQGCDTGDKWRIEPAKAGSGMCDVDGYTVPENYIISAIVSEDVNCAEACALYDRTAIS